MATRAVVVEELLRESGKTTEAVRRRIDDKVAAITVEILQQNEGKFKGLLKSFEFTTEVGERFYRLPPDFYSASDTFHEVDPTTREFVGRLTITTKAEIFDRKAEDVYAGDRMAFVEFLEDHADGRGWYLVLADDPEDARDYVLDYYRAATSSDTDIIRKVEILKRGVRGELPDLYVTAMEDKAVYLRMLSGVIERSNRFVPAMVIKPNKRVREHNRRMRRYGQGH